MSDYIPIGFSNGNLRFKLDNDLTFTDEFISFLWVDRFCIRFKERRMHNWIPYRSHVDQESGELVEALFDPLDGDRELYWPRRIKSREQMEAFLFKCDHHVHELMFNEFVFIDDCPELGDEELCLRVRAGLEIKLNPHLRSICARLEHCNHEEVIEMVLIGCPLVYQSTIAEELSGEGDLLFGLLSYANFEFELKLLQYTDSIKQAETLFSLAEIVKMSSLFPIRFEKDYLDCGSLNVPFSEWPLKSTFKPNHPFNAVGLKGIGLKSKEYIWRGGEEIRISHPFNSTIDKTTRIKDQLKQVIGQMEAEVRREKRNKLVHSGINFPEQIFAYYYSDMDSDNNSEDGSISSIRIQNEEEKKAFDLALKKIQKEKKNDKKQKII